MANESYDYLRGKIAAQEVIVESLIQLVKEHSADASGLVDVSVRLKGVRDSLTHEFDLLVSPDFLEGCDKAFTEASDHFLP